MDQWIAKAEAALRTGQPRLAMLYMRRGLSGSRAGRVWLARHDLTNTLRAFWRAFETGDAADLQRAYALAGPSKGVSHGNAV